jgi:hypothetical protein
MSRGSGRRSWPLPRPPGRPEDVLPDVRDGLSRLERIILVTLAELQHERGGQNVPTAMLYGRVVARIDVSLDELEETLQRLIGTRVS